MDTYQIYTEWCADHGHVAPSREQWAQWCSRNHPRRLSECEKDNREIEREHREGWTNDIV
jgi:hypothetical protein